MTKNQKIALVAVGVVVLAVVLMKRQQEKESEEPVLVATTRPLIIGNISTT